MVLQGKTNAYDTDIFESVFAKISEPKSESIQKERIIIDHTRTSVMFISTGLHLSNTDQGIYYVALSDEQYELHDELGMKPGSLFHVADTLIEQYRDVYENVGMT